jgi:hypothetical protein
MEIFVIVAVLALLGPAAQRWGADSRFTRPTLSN